MESSDLLLRKRDSKR